MLPRPAHLVLGFFLTVAWVPDCSGYSVLSHEAILDAAWSDIEPVLLNRFPDPTPEDLRTAHAFAYGGTIIQDLGYYPFGSRFFSDLTHYVRTGDFVLALMEEARDLNEYAFALGALAHYVADDSGHRLATNRAVGMMYPGLAKKYGPSVTYETKPSAHKQVEFGFDVEQVAKRHYAPQAYHDFIGFEVSKPVLEKAFSKTYSLDLSDVFKSVDLAIASYRRAVSKVIPRMTKVAWHLKRDEIQQSDPSEARSKFLYNISKTEYSKEWGQKYKGPRFSDRFKAFFLRGMPKVGPLSGLAFHPPTPAVEELYFESFNEILDRYRSLLREAQRNTLTLPNDNLDTGGVTTGAVYGLTDNAYAKLLSELNGRDVSSALREDIVFYYSDRGKRYATKKHLEAWQEVCRELDGLKSTK